MQDVREIRDLPQAMTTEKIRLPEGHEVEGCYARNGYPDGIYKTIPDGIYEVVAQWDNQLMLAVTDEEDTYVSSKHRYVIKLF